MLTLDAMLATLSSLYGSAAAIGRAVGLDRRHLDLITKRGRMPDHVIVRAAELAGLEPAHALCSLHLEHAADDATKSAWLAAIAAIDAAKASTEHPAAPVITAPTNPPPETVKNMTNGNGLYYVK